MDDKEKPLSAEDAKILKETVVFLHVLSLMPSRRARALIMMEHGRQVRSNTHAGK